MNLTKHRMAVGYVTLGLLFALTATGQTAPPNELRDLPPNQTIEREMIGAQTHRYKIDLKLNEFFQVRVEQKGVDVMVKLLDMAGGVLAAMDSPNGREGPETLSFVAEKTGSFVLEVSGFDAKAEKGRYIILRETPRTATEKDQKELQTRLSAKKTFDEAESLSKAKDKESLHEAINKYEQASLMYQEIGDNLGEGFSLFNAGLTLFSLGEKAAAMKALEQSLAPFSRLVDKNYQSVALFSMGRISSGMEEKIKALEYYDQALQALQKKVVEDKRLEADILEAKGAIYSSLNNKLKALEFGKHALLLRRAVGDKTKEASTLNAIGVIYSSLGEQQDALGYFNQALSLGNDLSNKQIKAKAMQNIGRAVYIQKQTSQEALTLLNQALLLSREIRDKKLEAAILSDIGSIYSETGEKQKALEYFNNTLLLDRSAGDKGGEALSLVKIGQTYSSFAEWQKAVESFDLALPLFKLVRDRSGEGETLLNIGRVYKSLGATQEALKYFNLSLSLSREINNKELEAATLDSLAQTYLVTGESKKALSLFNQSLLLTKQFGNKRSEAISLSNIGGALQLVGEKEKALEYLNQALVLHKMVGDRSGEAGTLAGLGDTYFDLGNPQKALALYHQALTIFRVTGEKDRETKSLGHMMGFWKSLQQSNIAIFYGKQTVNKIQELRQAIEGLNKEIQKAYLKLVEPVYRALADLLIEQGRFVQAEQVLSMLKEEEYFDFVRRDAGELEKLAERVPLNEKEKTLIGQYSRLADKITEIGQEFIKLDDKKRQLSRNDLSLSAVEQKRYEELEKQLDTANAAFQLLLTKELVAEIGQVKAGEIEFDRNLQDKLRQWGEGTVALYTVVGADRYRVILTTPKGQVDGKTEIKIADLNKKVFAFRAALQNPKVDPRPLGKELYDILIKPIENELRAAKAKTLVWSLDGTIRYIPLAALSPDGKRYFVEDVQNIVITPKTRDDVSDSNVNWQALGLGVSEAQTVENPDDKSKKIPFGGLPGTERELLAIVRDEKSKVETGVLLGRRLMNNDFTTTALKDSLAKETEDGKRKYNVIHIASHFRLGSNDSNSFILLGSGQILTLEEIRNSSTIDFGNVELITLSACNTGFADDTNGKEIDSLASVIQTKGGKAVLATLWAVADESTSLMMSEFYHLRKEKPSLTKSQAIQRAQLAIIVGKIRPTQSTRGRRDTSEVDNTAPNYSHPYYWSPFILIGNWR